MRKSAESLAAFVMMSVPIVGRRGPATGEAPGVLKAGVVLREVQTLARPEQSYALYLPSAYSSDKRWPIVYAFDPGARGSLPVELMKEAAESYGYIVAGSNNSRNGSRGGV